MMKDRRRWFSLGLVCVVLLFCVGCAGGTLGGNYAKVWPASSSKGVTIHSLVEDWQAYDIYYAGLGVDTPSAIMFDAKQDGRRLTSDKWVPVTDQQTAKRIVGWIHADIAFYPILYEILGPDNAFFGYMYTACEGIVVKVIDDKTLWVDDLPLPPIDYGPTMAR